MMVKMSARQYTLLGQFISASYSLEDVRTLNQTTFGSALYQNWIKQKGTQFDITSDGKAAYYSYGSQDILRRSITSALSKQVKGWRNGR